jgi:hypothetical protein
MVTFRPSYNPSMGKVELRPEDEMGAVIIVQ